MNGDFENWHIDSMGAQKLDNWNHFQNDADRNNYGLMPGTWRVTNAQNGNYALKLSRWYASDVDNVRQWTAISQKPGSLSGYYIYEDPNLTYNINGGTGHITDTALVFIYLTHWNATLQNRDTLGSGMQRLGAVGSYTPFSLPIQYISTAQPDSASVAIFPTSYPDTSNSIVCKSLGTCSFLTIDNLQLQVSTSVISLNEAEHIELFPNPAF
ncbi:MAG: hypothetical protein ABI169_18320, partial [Chitinophagaceae bacterium]